MECASCGWRCGVRDELAAHVIGLFSTVTYKPTGKREHCCELDMQWRTEMQGCPDYTVED